MVSTSPRQTSNGASTLGQNWSVSDRVLHKAFGVGQITNIFGQGSKITLAVKFPGIGIKIIDPKIAQLQRAE
jgi:DNA helicase-2/ATP-dependent DNA helicase PcrA